MVKNRAHKVFWENKDKQKRKFDRLLHQRTSPSRVHQHQDKKVVVNLSKRELSENEEQVLALGMNFANIPKEIPTDEVITGTEPLARYLCLETAMELRRLVKSCLMDVKPPKPNLTKDQTKMLNGPRRDNSIVILPAHKWKAVVLLDASDYHYKIDKILSDGNYTLLDKDPKRKLEARLSKILIHLDKEGKLPS